MNLPENIPLVKPQNPFSFVITTDPDEVDNDQHYSEEITALMNKTYVQVVKKKPHLIPHLQNLIQKYPNIPAFKNYLVNYYLLSKKPEKAYELNRRLVQEHPDYLHGKIMLAKEYLAKKQFGKVPEILGEALDLQALFPHRRVFHLSEFQPFFLTTCEYLIETGNLEEAEKRIEQAETLLGKDHPLTKNLGFSILAKRVEQARYRFQEQDEWRDSKPFKARGYDTSIQTDEKPALLHSEVEALYHLDLQAGLAIYQDILALPRETLLQDLETVLWDCVRRYEYYTRQGYNEDEMTFPLHTLFLLAGLKATEKLPLLLDLLRQGDDLLEFWFSDHRFETLWHFVYRLGNQQLDVLKDFLFEPEIHHLSKTYISQAVSQIPLHQPERRQEIIEFYRDVFTWFLDHLDDEKLIDLQVFAPMICDVADFHAKELMPIVQRFYDEDLVQLDFAGDYDEWSESMLEEESPDDKHTIYESSFDHVQHIVKTWHDPQPQADPEPPSLEDKQWNKPVEPARLPSGLQAESAKPKAPKVGRNEPCPCGSGRKYKHCCGKGK